MGTQRSYDFLGKVWRVWTRKRWLFSRKCLRLLTTNLFLWHDKLETIKTCKLVFLWDWICSVIAFHKMMLYLLYLCLFVVLIRVILYGLIQLLKCYDYRIPPNWLLFQQDCITLYCCKSIFKKLIFFSLIIKKEKTNLHY